MKKGELGKCRQKEQSVCVEASMVYVQHFHVQCWYCTLSALNDLVELQMNKARKKKEERFQLK